MSHKLWEITDVLFCAIQHPATFMYSLIIYSSMLIKVVTLDEKGLVLGQLIFISHYL